ncbi:hypothetical protein H2198_006895 [Neophaeococcomyces mojaviensis]|uniref:Uncharacterized protein n=1 Tax=Neophaeococcomyces mojaviensis TaxID=3383035 RepID=A0ACC3A1J5_9EURO|nr:hypothetical protein H2198_006895 [Knufia sp. JES_112]
MDSATIEQMNKLRKSLGLPLLGGADSSTDSDGLKFKENTDGEVSEEPASTLATREAAGYENFRQVQEDEKKRVEREQRKRAIQKAKDAAARLQRLEGRGLGDAGGEEDDAKSWLKGQKKRQKDIEKERARKLEEELAERERQAALEYTSSDLAGVQVAHEIGDFEDGTTEQILTLKDQEIGKDNDDSEEGDILENAELIARDKLKEKLDAKKKIRYDVHDNEEKGMLTQYDEKKRKAFTLDAQGSSVEERESKRQQIGERLKNTVSLDILKTEPVSDYQEIKIKKPKKFKKKNLRQKEIDEDEVFPATTNRNGNGNAMDLDTAAPTSRSKSDTNFNDDEDLASALTFTRKAALKKKKLKPEDLVKQIREEEEDAPIVEGGLILDDTTNFLDNLEARPRDEQPQPVQKSIENLPAREISPVDEDEHMADAGQAYTVVEGDEQALLESLKKEQSGTPDPSFANPTGLEEEQTLSSGLGSTLSLLRSRGVIKSNEDINDKNALYRARQQFITEARLREHDSDAKARAQRERDRASGKHQGLSTREREEQARWQNEHRAQQSSIAAAAAFNKEYKPDVNIKYVDDDGRLLNQKEAFKHLSHQFHGKGSGKQKTEKHLKKIEEEKRREAKSVLDSSTDDRGMQRAQGTMGKRDKVAGVRLG